MFFNRKLRIFLFLLQKNILCGYSLEAPQRGASNEYSQHMFLLRQCLPHVFRPTNLSKQCRYRLDRLSTMSATHITKTCLYNFDPLKSHFYIVKLGFTGVYIIFLISAQKIDCGYSLEPPQ